MTLFNFLVDQIFFSSIFRHINPKENETYRFLGTKNNFISLMLRETQLIQNFAQRGHYSAETAKTSKTTGPFMHVMLWADRFSSRPLRKRIDKETEKNNDSEQGKQLGS